MAGWCQPFPWNIPPFPWFDQIKYSFLGVGTSGSWWRRRRRRLAASAVSLLQLRMGHSVFPGPSENMAHFHEEGQGHQLFWHTWCFWFPAVAEVLVSAPGLDLVNIASLVPPTFCNFSSCFYAGRKKSNNSNCSLPSLISSTARTSSSPPMPTKIAVFKWRCRETPFFPWRRQTSRDSARDMQDSLNGGRDLSLFRMSNLGPVLVTPGVRVVKVITSERVSWEMSLEFPMNNLFGLTTTNCHLIICRTWSSALSHSLPLSLWTSAMSLL